MTYHNGYPENVEIGIHEMSIDDVEHLILTLSSEDNIHPVNRIMLWDNYTKARAQYWDAQFDMDEDEKKRLYELGHKVIAQIEEMYALRDRLLRQELEKIKNGKRGAKSIELETVIQNWYSEDATDMEVDFYNGLFASQTNLRNFYNLCKCYTSAEYEEQNRTEPNYWKEKYTQLAEDGILQIVHKMKEDINLAWKDLDKILDFEMKVRYIY
jgi:hypothetical protein